MLRHVRRSNDNVRDHRYRSTSRLPNKLRPTLCGADPTMDDRSRKDAVHLIEQFSAIKPEWVAEICERCREILQALKK